MKTAGEVQTEIDRLTSVAREYTVEEWERMRAIAATLRWVLDLYPHSPVDRIDLGFDETTI